MEEVKGIPSKIINEKVSGGYKVKILDKVISTLICSICHLLMRVPVQTVRGLLACKRCYEEAKGDSDRCPIDGEPIKDDEVFPDKHHMREILRLRCECAHEEYGCDWEGNISEVEIHGEKCVFKPISCLSCQENVCTQDINLHLRDCLVSHGNGNCLYPGCAVKVNSGDELQAHMNNDSLHHTLLMLNFTSEAEKAAKRNKENQDALELTISNLSDGLLRLKMDHESKLNQLAKTVEDLQRRPIAPISTTTAAESGAVSSVRRQLETLNLKQQLLDNRSCDGRLIWKIDRVMSRMEDAKMGRILALHSAPVFTEMYGYKFCGRIFLNGDGLGRTTHVSLFFVLMKSEYDSLLTWPFKKRISMRLINQKDRRLNVFESFDSDVTTSSFQRPVKDMNVSSGCPKFVTQKHLLEGGFVKDDCFFIEMIVKDVAVDQGSCEFSYTTDLTAKAAAKVTDVVDRRKCHIMNSNQDNIMRY